MSEWALRPFPKPINWLASAQVLVDTWDHLEPVVAHSVYVEINTCMYLRGQKDDIIHRVAKNDGMGLYWRLKAELVRRGHNQEKHAKEVILKMKMGDVKSGWESLAGFRERFRKATRDHEAVRVTGLPRLL